jgi:hypothetical protein
VAVGVFDDVEVGITKFVGVRLGVKADAFDNLAEGETVSVKKSLENASTVSALSSGVEVGVYFGWMMMSSRFSGLFPATTSGMVKARMLAIRITSTMMYPCAFISQPSPSPELPQVVRITPGHHPLRQPHPISDTSIISRFSRE